METKSILMCYSRYSLCCLVQNMTHAQLEKMRTEPLFRKQNKTTTKQQRRMFHSHFRLFSPIGIYRGAIFALSNLGQVPIVFI